jgi:ATP-dependent helicase/nuclease subunit A
MKKTHRWPHLVIRASAGTGKTFQLSNRYLELLAAGVPGEQILATTFTRKAAGEILERVLFRLADAATDDRALEQLSKFIAGGKLSRDACLALLEQAARNVHRLRVGTLDSFFMAIAGSFSLELGLPSGWTIADEVTDQLLRVKAIEATLAQDATQDLLTLVHLLTKAETTRSISRVVQDAVDGVYSMFLETSPEAWQQLPRVKGLEESEFHDVLQQIEDFPLTGELDKKRRESLDRALAGDWEKFVEAGLGSKILAGAKVFNRKEIPPDLIALFERLLAHARASLLNPIVFHTQGTYQLLEKFDREYQRLKQEQRVLRFDDVTRIVAQSALIRDGARLGFRMDGGVKHLLLDEFQDTSLAQWQVLRPFAKEVTQSTDDASFFCVGDTKQAIYVWRGGIAQIFEAIEGELTGLQNQQLVQSFRSAPPVIETANKLFQNLTLHTSLERYDAMVRQWQQQFPEHSTARGDLPGYVCVKAIPEAPEDADCEEYGDAYVAGYVQQLLADAPGMEIGVLVRKNDTVRRLIFALRALGIPASEEGGNPLIDSAAVGLILSLLQLADHPGDTVAHYHLATSPLGAKLGLSIPMPLNAAALLSADLRRELLRDGFGPTVLRWSKLVAPECNQRELSRLDQLVELAFRYQPQGSLRADRFIALVEQQKVSDPSAAPVRVMNVHQAKGLQFDVVVLPELNVNLFGQTPAYLTGRASPIEPVTTVCGYAKKSFWPLFPPEFQKLFERANDQHVVEMLCMLYVATTRAVHSMHILLGCDDATCTNPPKSLAGLVRAALCECRQLTPGEVAYEAGDKDWYAKIKPAPQRAAPLGPAPALTITLKDAHAARQRGWQSISPSKLEGGDSLAITEVFRPARSAGQDFGTLLHAWLSRITWLEEGVPSVKQLERIAVEEVGWQSDVRQPLQQYQAWLAQPALQSLLTRAAFLKDPLCAADDVAVENERRFALREDGRLMTGSVDRIVLYRQGETVIGADILDYKTDSLRAGDKEALAAKVDYYRPQLLAYASAVQRMYDLQPTQCRARLVFLGAGDVVCVEEGPPAKSPPKPKRPAAKTLQKPLF